MVKPIISLILCSRNDEYMGNSLWRLQTALNYAAQNVHELGREDDVEIIVTDWGSEAPLRGVLQLSAAAARIVSFIYVPPALARQKQQDSPFSEVYALNAAARRSRGQYVGRIDADTLVSRHFFETFFEMLEGSQQPGVPLDSVFMFARRRHIPYRFAVRCPPLSQVARFIQRFGHRLPIDGENSLFFRTAVGTMLMHRNLWGECGGYDERLIYMNFMEIDLAYRLAQEYELVDLGAITGLDFYHLEHYHPLKRRYTSRNTNPYEVTIDKDKAFHPNSADWGLASYCLEVLPSSLDRNGPETTMLDQSVTDRLTSMVLLLCTGIQIAGDQLIARVLNLVRYWKRRAAIAWSAVQGHSVMEWPGLLMRLWTERGSGMVR